MPAGAPEIWAALLDLQSIGSFLGYVRFRVIKIVGHWEASQWLDPVLDRLENHRRYLRRVSVCNKHGGMPHKAVPAIRYRVLRVVPGLTEFMPSPHIAWRKRRYLRHFAMGTMTEYGVF